jgi:thymidylate synthase
MINNIDKVYQSLLQDIIDNGVRKSDRTGTGTISVFGRQIRHKMSEGFPLLTTKKMAWKTMITELLWFLRGDTNIKYLVDNGCHIWDGDAYKNYRKIYEIESRENTSPYYSNTLSELHMLEDLSMEQFIEKIKTDNDFARKWGELGPIYGNQWREWGSQYEYNYITQIRSKRRTGIDQIYNLINEIKTNPDSRRLMVNAWNVGELDNMVLPPCHYGFQVYTRELGVDERNKIFASRSPNDPSPRISEFYDRNNIPKRAISLMWNQRSVDTFLGLPFNIASYGLLLEIIAREVNMVPDQLIGNLGDVHLYLNHIDQAKEQINREPYELPSLEIHRTLFEFGKPDPNKLDLDYYSIHSFELSGYQSHPSIKAPLSN